MAEKRFLTINEAPVRKLVDYWLVMPSQLIDKKRVSEQKNIDEVSRLVKIDMSRTAGLVLKTEKRGTLIVLQNTNDKGSSEWRE